MADDPTTPGSETQTGANPDEGTQAPPPTTPNTDPTQGQDPTEEPFDKDRALETIRKLRPFEKQAKAQERELADYKRKEEEARVATLSEQQKLQEQLKARDAELELERQTHRDSRNQYEVQLHASRLGIVDPDVAVKLLDWGALDYDDDGRPVDVEAALKDLLEAKPYLARQPETRAAATSPTNPATRTQSPGSRRYTSAEIADRAFWTANKDDIMRAFRENRIDS